MSDDENKMMKTEIRASLILMNYGCSHADVTAAFGVEPSMTWNVGDLMPSGRRNYKTKGWRFWSSLPLSATMEQHAVHLLGELKPDFAKLQMLGWPKAVMSFAVESYNGDRPALGLDHPLMEKLAAMKVDLDIDLYVL